ncbi:site-specific integrase, partial [Streptococcus pneumoniae]
MQKANTKLEKPINQPLSSHIFRHTLLSTLAEKNAIMVRVEHKNAKTVNNIYTHVSKRMEQATLEVLNTISPNHSYLSQLDVTYKTPDLMSHFLPPHEVSFTFCCSSIVF